MLDNSAEMLDCVGERLTLDLCCPDAYGKTDFFNTIGHQFSVVSWPNANRRASAITSPTMNSKSATGRAEEKVPGEKTIYFSMQKALRLSVRLETPDIPLFSSTQKPEPWSLRTRLLAENKQAKCGQASRYLCSEQRPRLMPL
jgi:hypothetical protein